MHPSLLLYKKKLPKYGFNFLASHGMTRHFCNFDNSSPQKQISKTYNSCFTKSFLVFKYICSLEIIVFASPQQFIRHNQFCTISSSMGMAISFFGRRGTQIGLNQPSILAVYNLQCLFVCVCLIRNKVPVKISILEFSE